MKFFNFKLFLWAFLFLCEHFCLYSQKIYFSKDNYSLFEPIELIIEVPELLINQPNIPMIDGLDAIGSSQSFKKINQKNIYSYYYLFKANRTGIIKFPSFQLQYAKKTIEFKGKKISIFKDESFLSTKPQNLEILKINPYDVFFEIQFSKSKAFVGEQIQQKVFLFIKDNLIDKVFFEPQSVQNLLTNIKNTQFWEENLDSIPFQNVSYEYKNGIKYQKFLLNFSCLYPFFPGSIRYESLPLKLKKKKYLTNEFIENPLEEFTIYSNPIELEIKEVPYPNLLTGNFFTKIKEIPQKISLGEKIDYEFTVFGNGNLNTLKVFTPKINKPCDIFENQHQTNQYFKNNELYHSLNVHFQILPTDTGLYSINELLIPFFNTQTQKKDFLKIPNQSFYVQNVNIKIDDNQYISNKNLGNATYTGWNVMGVCVFLSIIFVLLWLIFKQSI